MKENKNKILPIVYTAMGASIITVLSWISIPFFAVPFTLQTLAIFLVVLVFGSKIGLASTLLYILMGLIGLPVFAGFSAGFSVLFGTTGGYIFGFIFIDLSYLLFTELFSRKIYIEIISLIVGLILCYLIGTIWFTILYSTTNPEISFISSLTICVLPFIIPDLLKMFLGFLIARVLRKNEIINKIGLSLKERRLKAN